MSTDLGNNDPRFVGYYEQASATDKAFVRASGIMESVLRSRRNFGLTIDKLKVADIGCNAGTQSRCWLECAHHVSGVDISSELISLARERNAQYADRSSFEVCSATKLNWADNVFDVSLLPELLEHVDDWEACVNEAVRVLKPGGSIFLSTTNVLCPMQQEFDLPFYSWYPARLKRHFEKKSVTTSPHLVNFTSFPAVHWFSPYSLKTYLNKLGVTALDRFDLIDVTNRGLSARILVESARRISPVRFIGHVLTPSTIIVGHKRN